MAQRLCASHWPLVLFRLHCLPVALASSAVRCLESVVGSTWPPSSAIRLCSGCMHLLFRFSVGGLGVLSVVLYCVTRHPAQALYVFPEGATHNQQALFVFKVRFPGGILALPPRKRFSPASASRARVCLSVCLYAQSVCRLRICWSVVRQCFSVQYSSATHVSATFADRVKLCVLYVCACALPEPTAADRGLPFRCFCPASRHQHAIPRHGLLVVLGGVRW
jgi:hypothetical protein